MKNEDEWCQRSVHIPLKKLTSQGIFLTTGNFVLCRPVVMRKEPITLRKKPCSPLRKSNRLTIHHNKDVGKSIDWVKLEEEKLKSSFQPQQMQQ